MVARIQLLILICCMWGCQEPQTIPEPQITTFPLSSSVRAIQVLDAETVWFTGTGGQFGYTEDGGESWQIDSLRVDSVLPEFRALRIVEDTVLLMSVATPALMMRSEDKGNSWEVVYKEDHPSCYYNSMSFWDHKNGMAVGDPTDSCLSIILTEDGGKSWYKRSCENIPPLISGEAQFAASNTNIVIQGEDTWLVTGAAAARVFHSSDRAQSWEVYDTPIQQGGQMTGIFSAAFYGTEHGLLFGGDWENQADNSGNKAITKDGGKTWALITDGEGPGYRSCVQYQPGTNGKGVWAVGKPGMSYSADGGQNWTELGQEGFYTIRFTEDGKHAWLAGRDIIASMSW